MVVVVGMLDTNCLMEKIRTYTQKEKLDIYIYPFGANGMNAYRLLLGNPMINSVHIVDNYFKDENIVVIDSQQLRKEYRDGMVVLLTAEKIDQHNKIATNIKEFVKDENIIDWLDICSCDNDLEKFQLEYWLPKAIKQSDSDRIKIRIYAGEIQHWNTLDSFYKSCVSDEEIDVQLLANYNLAKSAGNITSLNCMDIEQYDIETDCPDVFIVTNPFDTSIYTDKIRKYSRFVIVINLSLICYRGDIGKFCRLLDDGFGVLEPDYYLFDSYLYQELMKYGFKKEKLVEMGNGKYDGIYEAVSSNVKVVGWEKLEHKKVFLWATDHGLSKLDSRIYVSSDLTFDIFAKLIFDYVSNHQDIGLIFRPHPMFLHELAVSGGWTAGDFAKLRSYCDASDNIIFDESINYNNALAYADGILVDAHCGMLASVLPTLKPVCVLYRNSNVEAWIPRISEIYFKAYDFEDVTKFIYETLNGINDKLEERLATSKKYVKYFDGKNGFRIKEYLKKIVRDK